MVSLLLSSGFIQWPDTRIAMRTAVSKARCDSLLFVLVLYMVYYNCLDITPNFVPHLRRVDPNYLFMRVQVLSQHCLTASNRERHGNYSVNYNQVTLISSLLVDNREKI